MAAVHPPILKAPVAFAAAIAAGLVLLAAFPPLNWWWCAPLGVALLAAAVPGRGLVGAAGIGILAGLAFFVPMLHWTGLYVGAWPWLLLSVVQAAYFVIVTVGLWCWLGLVERWSPGRWLTPIVVAGIWVAQEAIRGRAPFGGFGWGRLAFGVVDSPVVVLAAIGGAPLVSAAVGLLGGLLVLVGWSIARRWDIRFVAIAAIAVIAFLGVGVWGGATQRPATKNTMRIAVVQGNVPRAGLEFNAQRRAVLDNHAAATMDLAASLKPGERIDLVIWPENSSDIDPLVYRDAAKVITEAAQAIQAPILIGAVLENGGNTVVNAGLVWQPDGTVTDRYEKRHPVPFAEYVPFRSVLRKITTKVDLVRRDFVPGDAGATIDAAGVRLADVICFEVVNDDLVASGIRDGGELIVVQTNNATFGKTAQSEQQLAMVRLRAIEHGRDAVMASTTGVSARVDIDGDVRQQTNLFRQEVLVANVTLRDARTVATNIGAWPEGVLAAVGGAGILAGIIMRRRHRHADPISGLDKQRGTNDSGGADEPGARHGDEPMQRRASVGASGS